MQMILDFLFNFIFSMGGSIGFAIIFNAPRKELFLCGITGASGWIMYYLIMQLSTNDTLATFLGAMTLAAFSRIFSYTRQAPSTLFLITGLIPLVPGYRTYTTMKALLSHNMEASYLESIAVMKLAGVIAVGIIIIFTLPYKTFELVPPKKK